MNIWEIPCLEQLKMGVEWNVVGTVEYGTMEYGTMFSRWGSVVAVCHEMKHVPLHGLQLKQVGIRLYESDISTWAPVYNVWCQQP